MTHDMLGVNLYTCHQKWFDLFGVRIKYEVADSFVLISGSHCLI